jgi:hypothetical protein
MIQRFLNCRLQTFFVLQADGSAFPQSQTRLCTNEGPSARAPVPDGRRFFTDNPIKRYSIGDRTPGLSRSADGSLEIYIQREAPSGGRETNWLPTPAGRFSMTLRAYLPKQELLEHRYAPPSLTRLN